MKQILSVLLSLVLFAVVSCEVYFSEEFNDGEGWKDRWVLSTSKGSEAGDFGLSSGKYHADESDVGLKTLTDARFYQISAETKEFSNKDKTLVLQFSVKHEQGIDCGGGYVKILPAGLDQSQFNGDSEYNIMFGPDICGATKRTHFIITYKGKNHLIRTDIRTESDTYSHVYTLILRPDQTFTVKIDNNEVRSGSLTADFDILPPKDIPDPSVSKPADWVDVKEIPDPSAQKPEGWDDIPAKIRDPEAQQPEEWDSELDGEWEAPLIDNPEYKGEWVAPMIPNPEYKGPWIHPKIPNPDYSEDANIYAFDSNKYVGIEIWQVKAGSIFDNFLVTDDVSLAEEWAARTIAVREAEKEKAKADAPAPSADGSRTVEVEPEIESYDEEEELDGGHDEL